MWFCGAIEHESWYSGWQLCPVQQTYILYMFSGSLYSFGSCFAAVVVCVCEVIV